MGKQKRNPKKPSARQIEAYKYLYVLDVGTHEDVAELMGCNRSNVTRLIGRLKNSNPDLFDDEPVGKTGVFTANIEHKVVQKW